MQKHTKRMNAHIPKHERCFPIFVLDKNPVQTRADDHICALSILFRHKEENLKIQYREIIIHLKGSQCLKIINNAVVDPLQ